MTFDGRVALITGSGRGIGKESAIQMAKKGATIILNDTDDALLQKAKEEIESLGAKVLAVNADVTKPEPVLKMVRTASDLYGGIDILVNNVGGSLRTPRFLEEVTEETWARVVNLNLDSQFRCTKAVVPYMKQNRWGRIVNISSSAGTHGEEKAWSPPYAAAKAGVLGFTKQVAIEFGRYGITCNAIAQGDTDTERSKEMWSEGLWPETPEQIEERYKENPIPRFAKPSEVAAVVVFLASEESSYVNAETIMVTGGAWISP